LIDRSLTINLDKSIDLGLKQLDALKMCFDQSDWRKLLPADELCHAYSRQKD
jgi:hypothetical protein